MMTQLRFAVLVFGIILLLRATAASAADKPNILILYADDLGWGELSCYGGKEIPTPHIDSLAKNGVRCTQGYVAATYCSPSRAGLMSGRYPTRFGHEFNGTEGASGFIKETTLANRLKAEGYATTCIGKWHLGGSLDRLPTSRGFDEFFGTVANTPFYHPNNFIDSRKSNDVIKIDDPNFYTTTAYTERAIDWLKAHQKDPWFLYLPFNAVHAPHQAPKEYLEKFAKSSRPDYAASLSAMDDAIGRVLGTLRDLKLEENTLIFFIADNGGPMSSANGPLRGKKTQTYEGGPRVPYVVQWKGKLPAGKTYDLPVMNLDVMPTCLAAAGKTISSDAKLDGVDLFPFLTGANTERTRNNMYWRFGDQWAVRSGDWKLVVAHGGSGKPELYNLAADIGEQKDLAATEPQRVAELQKLYDAWNAEQAEPAGKMKSGKKKEAKKAEKKKAKKANAA